MKKILNKVCVLGIIYFLMHSSGVSLPVVFCDETPMIDVLDIKDMDIVDVLKVISQKSGFNIIAGQEVKGKVSVYLKNMPAWEILKQIIDAHGFAYVKDQDVIRVMTAKNYELRYGHLFGRDIKTLVKPILFGKATELVRALEHLKSSEGKIVADDKTNNVIIMDMPQRVKDIEQIIDQMDVPIKTEVFDLSYAKAEDVSGKIAEMLTPGIGAMRFDQRLNKIIVSDTEEKIERVAYILRSFDGRHRQVFIEAKIVQVILNNEHKLGIDWEALLSSKHDVRMKGDLNILSSLDKKGQLHIGALEKDDYTAVIESLETVGDTHILSSPRIATLNNEEAKMTVGFTEPYVTSTVTTPSSGPATTAESVNFIDVGVKLYVTPTIHKDDFITMKIRPEISSVVDNLTTSTHNSIPIVETSQAETQVMVKNGMTIIIGGLIKKENIQITKKIPFLGSLPLLGAGFRNTYQKESKTEIVIFLTPEIMSGEADALVSNK